MVGWGHHLRTVPEPFTKPITLRGKKENRKDELGPLSLQREGLNPGLENSRGKGVDEKGLWKETTIEIEGSGKTAFRRLWKPGRSTEKKSQERNKVIFNQTTRKTVGKILGKKKRGYTPGFGRKTMLQGTWPTQRGGSGLFTMLGGKEAVEPGPGGL